MHGNRNPWSGRLLGRRLARAGSIPASVSTIRGHATPTLGAGQADYLFRSVRRGRFQYGDLHLGQTFGSPSSRGIHWCSHRSHFQAQTVTFTFAMAGLCTRQGDKSRMIPKGIDIGCTQRYIPRRYSEGHNHHKKNHNPAP